jgi:3',5'-cyclic AMP phosphodiesterase CpdA
MGRIFQFSDIHFGAENKAAVEAARQHAIDNERDLILVTGDITQMGYRREFEAAAAWLATLPGPILTIPGNHDTPYFDLLARMFWPWKRFEKFIGPARDHGFHAPGLAVRGINTARAAQARPNWSKGVIDLDQTERAAKRLAEAPDGDLRILACHHPLIEMIGGPMTGEVKRGREAAQIFAAHGVDLVMSGHVHAPFALPITVGDKCSYAVGCGTLSLRERGVPPGFNCIEWDAETVQVTALGWTGSTFEAQRTWNLERRASAKGRKSA